MVEVLIPRLFRCGKPDSLGVRYFLLGWFSCFVVVWGAVLFGRVLITGGSILMKGCRFLVWSSLALIAQGICFIDAKHLEAT